MSLKMKELMELTGESKSTLLYYVKEGLLPEPKKPKPNVHLYDESCVERVRFIKYLQNELSYSISQIKTIFANNKFDFDNSFESLINSIDLLSGKKDLSKDEFLKETNLSESQLQEYINRGYLYSYNGKFGQKEVEIAKILKEANKLGLSSELFDAYVKAARELAKIENDFGYELLKDDSKTHNRRYKLLFDVILKLKPYIFNNATISEHKIRVRGEGRR